MAHLRLSALMGRRENLRSRGKASLGWFSCTVQLIGGGWLGEAKEVETLGSRM